MGVSADPRASPGWPGGEVAGRIAAEPSRAGLAERLLGKTSPPRPMIVAEQPAPGLAASAPPEPDMANSSRAYAVQWFFFAAAAALIYLLALRRRQREKLPPRP
jgi:surfeit locus 1 family protein